MNNKSQTLIKILKKSPVYILIFSTSILFFSIFLYGLFHLYLSWREGCIESIFAENDARTKIFDRDFQYRKNGYDPFIKTDPTYKTSIFLFGDFKNPIDNSTAETLSYNYKSNVIAPVTGIMSWPFSHRNRKWHFEEDMREASQIYDAYTANLPKDHRVIIISYHLGALQSAAIGLRCKRPADHFIYVAPINSSFKSRGISAKIRGLYEKRNMSYYFFPVILVPEKTTKEKWSYLKDLRATLMTTYDDNPYLYEINIDHEMKIKEAGFYLVNEIAPRTSKNEITVISTGKDMLFKPEGFDMVYEKFNNTENKVKLMTIDKRSDEIIKFTPGSVESEILSESLTGKQK